MEEIKLDPVAPPAGRAAPNSQAVVVTYYHRQPGRPNVSPNMATIRRPIAREAVAAGEGTLHT